MRRLTIMLLTIIGVTLTLAAGVALAQATYNPVECDGGNCQGTNGLDRIGGTEGRDKITAKAGEDLVYAGGGKDLVFGNNGADYLYGGEDKDELRGGGGGKDFIFGGTGSDELIGGTGDDDIVPADDEEADNVYCGPGKDVVLADPEDEVSDDCEIVESDVTVTPAGK